MLQAYKCVFKLARHDPDSDKKTIVKWMTEFQSGEQGKKKQW